MLANDAQQVVTPPTLRLPDRPSLAVMPFENLGGDPADDYFSDGMTDDLITDLSQLQGLFVIGRHSAFSYTRDQLDPPAIARDLGVRYLMVGSVRRGGDTLRVNGNRSMNLTYPNLPAPGTLLSVLEQRRASWRGRGSRRSGELLVRAS